jgi:hypothetical protein
MFVIIKNIVYWGCYAMSYKNLEIISFLSFFVLVSFCSEQRLPRYDDLMVDGPRVCDLYWILQSPFSGFYARGLDIELETGMPCSDDDKDCEEVCGCCSGFFFM